MLDDTRKSNIAPYRKNYSIFLIKIDFIRPIFDDLHRPNYPTPLYTNYLKVVVSEISHKLEITSFPEKNSRTRKTSESRKSAEPCLEHFEPIARRVCLEVPDELGGAGQILNQVHFMKIYFELSA